MKSWYSVFKVGFREHRKCQQEFTGRIVRHPGVC